MVIGIPSECIGDLYLKSALLSSIEYLVRLCSKTGIDVSLPWSGLVRIGVSPPLSGLSKWYEYL